MKIDGENKFSQFALPERDNTISRQPPLEYQRKTKHRKVIVDSDEEETPSRGSTVNASKSFAKDDDSDDDGWLDARSKLTGREKLDNIQKAKKSRIPKRENARTPVFERSSSNRKSASFLVDTPDEELSSSSKGRTLKEKFDQRQLFKQSEREKRLASRHSGHSHSGKASRRAETNSSASEDSFANEDSDSESEKEEEGDSDEDEDEDEDEDSDTNDPSGGDRVLNTQGIRSMNHVTVDLSLDEDDNIGSDDDERRAKKRALNKAQRILQQCKEVSNNLRNALIKWSGSGKPSTGITDSAGADTGCVSLTRINLPSAQVKSALDGVETVVTPPHRAQDQNLHPNADGEMATEAEISQILTDADIKQTCPDLDLKVL